MRKRFAKVITIVLSGGLIFGNALSVQAAEPVKCGTELNEISWEEEMLFEDETSLDEDEFSEESDESWEDDEEYDDEEYDNEEYDDEEYDDEEYDDEEYDDEEYDDEEYDDEEYDDEEYDDEEYDDEEYDDEEYDDEEYDDEEYDDEEYDDEEYDDEEYDEDEYDDVYWNAEDFEEYVITDFVVEGNGPQISYIATGCWRAKESVGLGSPLLAQVPMSASYNSKGPKVQSNGALHSIEKTLKRMNQQQPMKVLRGHSLTGKEMVVNRLPSRYRLNFCKGFFQKAFKDTGRFPWWSLQARSFYWR